MSLEKKHRKLADIVAALSEEHGYLEELFNEVEQLEGLFYASSALRGLIADSRVSDDKKRKVIEALLKDRFSPYLMSSIDYLISRGNSNRLFSFIHYLKSVLRKRLEAQTAVIRTAVELDDKSKKAIEEFISRKSQKPLSVKYETDPELIGGLILKIGDELIDASVRGRLERFRKSLSVRL